MEKLEKNGKVWTGKVDWDASSLKIGWDGWVQTKPDVPKEEDMRKIWLEQGLDNFVITPVDKEPSEGMIM